MHRVVREMGKSHKISRINFRKCDGVYADPVVMAADYVFGDSHDDSDVTWLFQKVDRWKNGSSFTSNTETTYGPDVEDTATSALTFEHMNPEFYEEKSIRSMHAPLKFSAASDGTSGISESDSHMPFNGVTHKKLKDQEISSILRKLRKGSTSSNWEEGESSKRSTSTTSSKA